MPSGSYSRLLLLATLYLVLLVPDVASAPLRYYPIVLVQPDGAKISCFVSGDEFFNWVHDKDGYTIIQDQRTGYYTYAESSEGLPVSSTYIVGQADPSIAGLSKYILPKPEKVREARAMFGFSQSPSGERPAVAPRKGTINNIVIFIRFSDQTEFGRSTAYYNDLFNSTAQNFSSFRNYFAEVSYNQLGISTTFYPGSGSVSSYQDSHPRSYFEPRSITNPGGYADSAERQFRETVLLASAVKAVSSLVPGSLVVDGNNDGEVDNVCFIVRGGPGAWDALLWPHQWRLSLGARINGKDVVGFNFQMEEALDSSGVGVLCHEMFHTLGLPDLYHYTDNGIDPVGKWDIMDITSNPPPHTNAYNKFRLGWISSIPMYYYLNDLMTATLHPLSSPAYSALAIRARNSKDEFFLVEYRRKKGVFESSLPSEGLLVYRVREDLYITGNSQGPPDNVYLYRPGGTLSANGRLDAAAMSADSGRTKFDDATDPCDFLSNGGLGGVTISKVGPRGEWITFQMGIGDPRGKAQISSLYEDTGATVCGQAKFWAKVTNTGKEALATDTVVTFYIGPGDTDDWTAFRSTPVAGLAPGESKWYGFPLALDPSYTAGTYRYYALVYEGSLAISDWAGPQLFQIPRGQCNGKAYAVPGVLTGAIAGGTARLTAFVSNIGGVELPTDAAVWFSVAPADATTGSTIGSVPVAGLQTNASSAYTLDWQIPLTYLPGRYKFWVRVEVGYNPISEWGGPQEFSIGAAATPWTQITSLYSIAGAIVGGSAKIWAQVKNVSSLTLPANTAVWFLIAPAGATSGSWIGFAPVGSLAPGDVKWFSFDWAIPASYQAGDYQYWACVYTGNNALSEKIGPQRFIIEPNDIYVVRITSLYPVSDAKPGGTATLWAKVKSAGKSPLPSNASVRFWVSDFSYVGATSIANLQPGEEKWYSYNWSIPSTTLAGNYSYWAKAFVENSEISDWSSGQGFTINATGTSSAEVQSLNACYGSHIGEECVLHARVNNTGETVLPSGAKVWFYVTGHGLANPWVGSATVTGLAAGMVQWYGFNWAIPRNATAGTYSLWARVYVGDNPIGPWSAKYQFPVNGW